MSLSQSSYAERLGFPVDAKVLILHIDDVGMSYESNVGTILAMEEGVANSLSIMMPCGWVPGFFHYLKEHPDIDAGLHLTLTAEWEDYRWEPLSGNAQVPGLVDGEGAMWPTVAEVVTHASADEVEAEIRAQIARSRAMGWEPTHLDSHMGTLFATPEFAERYVNVGIETGIPVMMPGGHNSFLTRGMDEAGKQRTAMARQMGQRLWEAGLPVLDDLHNESYGWTLPDSIKNTRENLQRYKTDRYIETIRRLEPGLTMVIMHCTDPSEIFGQISTSGQTREGDMLAMMDPRFAQFLKEEGIILTTWREVNKRRKAIKE